MEKEVKEIVVGIEGYTKLFKQVPENIAMLKKAYTALLDFAKRKIRPFIKFNPTNSRLFRADPVIEQRILYIIENELNKGYYIGSRRGMHHTSVDDWLCNEFEILLNNRREDISQADRKAISEATKKFGDAMLALPDYGSFVFSTQYDFIDDPYDVAFRSNLLDANKYDIAFTIPGKCEPKLDPTFRKLLNNCQKTIINMKEHRDYNKEDIKIFAEDMDRRLKGRYGTGMRKYWLPTYKKLMEIYDTEKL